jgi:hypothetical protein
MTRLDEEARNNECTYFAVIARNPDEIGMTKQSQTQNRRHFPLSMLRSDVGIRGAAGYKSCRKAYLVSLSPLRIDPIPLYSKG